EVSAVEGLGIEESDFDHGKDEGLGRTRLSYRPEHRVREVARRGSTRTGGRIRKTAASFSATVFSNLRGLARNRSWVSRRCQTAYLTDASGFVGASNQYDAAAMPFLKIDFG